MSGTPEGIRTPDLLIRSQTLYPAELRVPCDMRGHGKNLLLGRVSRFSVRLLEKTVSGFGDGMGHDGAGAGQDGT